MHISLSVIRDKVDIVYVTPLEGAFTKPSLQSTFGMMLDERKITLESDFVIEHIDAETKTIVSMDEREVAFDFAGYSAS